MGLNSPREEEDEELVKRFAVPLTDISNAETALPDTPNNPGTGKYHDS